MNKKKKNNRNRPIDTEDKLIVAKSEGHGKWDENIKKEKDMNKRAGKREREGDRKRKRLLLFR